MTTPTLIASHLNYHYGAVHAVRDVHLDAYPAELLAIIGPNGAGKSTVFGLLAGDLSVKPNPQTKIVLADQDITHTKMQVRASRGLGRSYQTAAPFATLTVAQNLMVAATALPSHAAQRLQGLDAVLHGSGLMEMRNTYVQDLPYADWKRLDLALALVQQPRVLLLDEPTAGLAQTERTAMMQWVRTLAIEQKMAVLFTEHNLDAVFDYADRILVLVRGTVLSQGTPQQIASDQQVQAAYTGSYQFKKPR